MLLQTPAFPPVCPGRGWPHAPPQFSGTWLLLSQKRHSWLKSLMVPEGPDGTSVWAGLRGMSGAKGRPRAPHSHGGENTVVGRSYRPTSDDRLSLDPGGSVQAPPQELPRRDEDFVPGWSGLETLFSHLLGSVDICHSFWPRASGLPQLTVNPSPEMLNVPEIPRHPPHLPCY